MTGPGDVRGPATMAPHPDAALPGTQAVTMSGHGDGIIEDRREPPFRP